jgi:signal transduction histidine kinase
MGDISFLTLTRTHRKDTIRAMGSRRQRETIESLIDSKAASSDLSLPDSTSRSSAVPRVLSLLAGATIASLLWLGRDELYVAVRRNWRELLFWLALILLSNLFDVEIAPLQFSLDTPLLLATALLYDPAVAAAVVLLGSADAREFRRAVSPSQAVYNRSQIAISAFFAGTLFHATYGSISSWPSAILGTALAVSVFHVLNTSLVAGYVAAKGQGSPALVLRRLVIGRPIEYGVTYFGYGILALVLARLFEEVGGWSVVLFLIPIVVAQMALVRAEKLRVLAERLRSRERLLELLSDRATEERRDERLRIARGLHDDVLQSLIRISQLGFFLKRETPSETQAADDAAELVQISNDTISILREVVGDLRKSPLGRGGLVRTLRDLSRDLQIQSRVGISVTGPRELPLSAEGQLAAYHVAKEGILNALKHARASSIQVRVHRVGEAVSVEVVDDGHGFDPGGVDESMHFGLGLLRERAHKLGGRLLVESTPGSGTRLIVILPVTSVSGNGAKDRDDIPGNKE